MPIFDDPSQLGTGEGYAYEDNSASGAGDLIWGSTPNMAPWQYGKYIKIDVPNWNNSTGTDPMGGVDPPLRSYLRLGSIEAPPFAQPPGWKPGKPASGTTPAKPGKWSTFKYTDGLGVPFPTPGKGPTPATPTWQNNGHYTNAWQGNLMWLDTQTAAQSSIVGLVWGAGGYNLPGNQVLNPDFQDEWGTGSMSFAMNAVPPPNPAAWQTTPQGNIVGPWSGATATWGPNTTYGPNDQLASGFAFTGPGGGNYHFDPNYYGANAPKYDQISGGLSFNMYQFAATQLANSNYTGATTIKSTGPAFYQQLVANAPDSTGEDLASLVKGFADDSRIRTIPQSPQLLPPTGKGKQYVQPASTWGPWGDLLGAQNTASRSTIVGPAIGYPQMTSLYVQAAPNWFDAAVPFGSRQTVGPTDPADLTAWTPLPGYYQDFAGPGYVSDADYRAIESYYLHTKGGWRDHSDGNRITTTRGDKVEVIRGNYKLIVLGRQDQAKSAVAGMDISGGQTDSSSGGLAATSTTDPSTLTTIFELKQGPDRQYRSWSTTKKGTGTVKVGADGVTVTVPSQGVTFGETWGWKTFTLTGVETQPILSGGSGPPAGYAGWRPWGQGIGGFAPPSNTATNNPTFGKLGAVNPAFPTKLPASPTDSVTDGETVPTLNALTTGGWNGTSPTTTGDAAASTAYQIRTGGINPTTVGLLWPAYQNLTETHVVTQSSMTAVDTQVTLSMGQIPTMSTVAGTILDPIAAQLGFSLSQTPPIASPSLPTDGGADITEAGKAVGAGGAQKGTARSGKFLPNNQGDGSYGSDGTGNPILVGTQQAASPFFNYAGIPLQQHSGGQMNYPPESVFPTPAVYVGQENILSDYRPYGPGYLFWPNPQTPATTPYAGGYTVNITQPLSSDTDPTQSTVGLNTLVRRAASLPKIRNSSTESHAMLSRTWSFVDSSFSHTEVTGMVMDAPPKDFSPSTTFPSTDPVATGAFPGDTTAKNTSKTAYNWAGNNASIMPLPGDTPGGVGFPAAYAGKQAGFYFATLDFPTYFSGGASTNQAATNTGTDPFGIQTWQQIAQGSGGSTSSGPATAPLTTPAQPVVFPAATSGASGNAFGGTPTRLVGKDGTTPATVATGLTAPPAQFTESIVWGNSVSHTEVQGWQHSMTHVVDNTSETIVDGTQHSRTAAGANFTESFYGAQTTTNNIQTNQTTTNNIGATQTTTNNVGTISTTNNVTISQTTTNNILTQTTNNNIQTDQTTNNNISGSSTTTTNAGETHSASWISGTSTTATAAPMVLGFKASMFDFSAAVGMLQAAASAVLVNLSVDISGMDMKILGTAVHLTDGTHTRLTFFKVDV